MRQRSLLLLPFCFLTMIVWASPRHSHGLTIVNWGNTNSENCEDQLQVSYDGIPTTCAEETKTLPNQPLQVTASENGGIRVTDWDQPNFSIKLCKAAVGGDASEFLKSVTLDLNGGRLTIKTPMRDFGDRWTTAILIKAPAGAKLELSVTNGGITLYKTNANTVAHAVNGGIDLEGVHGTVSADAVNGGISVENSGGNVTARVQNGGIDLKLGKSWEGGKLLASSENGGLSVEVPSNFASPLEVSASQHTSIECSAEICQKAQRTWDDDHRYFRLGTGQPVVRATTENGGVDISDVRPGEDEI